MVPTAYCGLGTPYMVGLQTLNSLPLSYMAETFFRKYILPDIVGEFMLHMGVDALHNITPALLFDEFVVNPCLHTCQKGSLLIHIFERWSLKNHQPIPLHGRSFNL